MAEITVTIDTDQQKQAISDSFAKLDPQYLVKNPVLFVVELGTIIGLVMTIAPGLFGATGSRVYYAVITVLLGFTVIFANYAEAYAELEGEAQADSLRALQTEAEGKLLQNDDVDIEDISEDDYEVVASTEIEQDAVVFVDEGDIIPRDGTVVEGSASVDESAITGESEPVIRQSGGDRTSVVGGTEVLSDRIKVEVTSEEGESFLDQMIGLVEDAQRQKTPNEIAMTILLSGLTLVFVVAVATMFFFGEYLASFVGGFAGLDVAELVALLVALMPTTIGALLAAIRVAGMTRVTRRNVIAKSGRAVEAAGDLDALILDKTGTITTGERVAQDFHPLGDADDADVVRASYQSSLYDETTEGRSIVKLAEKMNGKVQTDGGQSASEELDEPGDSVDAPRDVSVTLDAEGLSESNFVPFSAETRMSGIDLSDGTEIRKGAVDAVEEYATTVPGKLRQKSNAISESGGTPLAIAVDGQVVGIIELQDELKPGI
ncbi:HAD-IC family P-type ATPase, partial [Halobacterium salinarum]|nr:HAD-IC family P-type ATPase [Halobacterium salinarum]